MPATKLRRVALGAPKGETINGETVHGSEETKAFYDREGWQKVDGVYIDTLLFGVKRDGPIKRAAFERRVQRLLDHLKGANPPLDLLECGCGGNPEQRLLPLCSKYTGIDLSVAGIDGARRTLEQQTVPFDLHVGDICRLPFPDGSFDAVYSANAIGFVPRTASRPCVGTTDGVGVLVVATPIKSCAVAIAAATSQAAAYTEALRVLRSNGVAVFVMANPFPIAFPLRLAKRVAAITPILSSVLGAIRSKPPLPYLPMPLGWTRRVLEPFGSVSIEAHALASTWFKQHVPEERGLGRLAWRAIEYAEANFPVSACRFGNYVQIVVRKY